MLGIVVSVGWPNPVGLLILIALEVVVFGLAAWRILRRPR